VFKRKKKVNTRNKKELNFAITIIALNSIFLFLNSPLVILQIYEYVPSRNTPELTATINLFRTIGVYSALSYQAYTFIFYYKFNKIFKKEANEIIFCRSRAIDQTNNSTRKTSNIRSR
jgi:hypothetical protein